MSAIELISYISLYIADRVKEMGFVKKFFSVAIMIALNAASPAFARESPRPGPGCAATDAALPRDLQAWSERASPAAAVLMVGQAMRVPLVPLDDVRFVVPPETPGAPGTFGQTIAVDIDRADTYRISLSDGVWIDVVRNGEAVASTAHGHGPECSSIHKIVAFPLIPGRYILQFSGSPQPMVAVLVTPAI